MRLGALLIGTINLFLIFDLARRCYDETTGLIAAVLLSSSLYASVIAGTFILPDTPQSLFWLLSLLFFTRFLSEKKDRFLLLFGLSVGLGLLSKYQSIFLWGGALLYFWLYDREKLRSKTPFAAIGISPLLFLPVLIWNRYSGYSGFAYHLHRLGNKAYRPSLYHFFPELFGEIFYHNPFNYYLIASGLVFFAMRRKTLRDLALDFFLLTSLSLIAVVWALSFFNRTLSHWSGPSYYGLILVTARLIRLKSQMRNTKPFSWVLKAGVVFFASLIALAPAQVKFNFLLLSEEREPTKRGAHNPIADLMVWNAAVAVLRSEVARDLRDGQISPNYVLLCDKWFPAGHLDYYYAMPEGVKLYVLGDSNSQHNYRRVNKLRGLIPLGSDAYYISPSHHYKALESALSAHFESVSGPEVIPLSTAGKPVIELFIWRLRNEKIPSCPPEKSLLHRKMTGIKSGTFKAISSAYGMV